MQKMPAALHSDVSKRKMPDLPGNRLSAGPPQQSRATPTFLDLMSTELPTPEPTELDHAMADILNAFLRWPLPESVASDTCCNRPGKGRIGTNLMTLPETACMVQEVVQPIVAKLLKESSRALDKANSPERRYGEWKQYQEIEKLLDDTSTLCRRLVRALGSDHPISKATMDFLQENDLTGTPLRDGKPPSQYESVFAQLATAQEEERKITYSLFEHVLLRHRLIDPASIEDPDGFDNYATHGRIHAAFRELTGAAMQSSPTLAREETT